MNLLAIDPSCLITLITPGVLRDHAKNELARYRLPEDSAQRLHLVHTDTQSKGKDYTSYKEMAGLIGVMEKSFHEVFEALLKVCHSFP